MIMSIYAFVSNVIREHEHVSDDDELGTLLYLNLMCASGRLSVATHSRYLSHQVYLTPTSTIFDTDLESNADSGQWLNDEEFLSKHRVTRDQLGLIKNFIHDADVFWRKITSPIQIPTKHQLVMYLHVVGHEAIMDCI